MGAGPTAGLSLASAGLSAYGSIMQGESTKAADVFKSEELQRAAEYGELKASQVGAQMTRSLNVQLGNIDTIRAAAHADLSSPTGAAVRDYTEEIGTEKKTTAVDSILAQAQQDEASAAYLRQAGSTALLSGDIGAFAGLLKGSAGAIQSGVPGGSTPPVNIASA
jgi:hypothetical protein